MTDTKQVLAVNGSPRKGGNSEILLAAVKEGIEVAGGRVETIRLNSLKIRPCQGCGGCNKTGECVLEDDMTPLYEKILSVDRIIIASPIYFYSVTAQAKTFIDRTQALWSRKRLLEKKGEWKDDPNRKGLFLSVAATRGPKVFEGAVLVAKYAFDAMGVCYEDELLVRGVDGRGKMAEAKDRLKEAVELGKRFMR